MITTVVSYFVPICMRFFAVVTDIFQYIIKLELILASKMGENLLCYKLHLNSQQTSPIVSNHFAL